MRIIGLDVGEKRTGVAKVDTEVKISLPCGTVIMDGTEREQIDELAKKHGAKIIVIGMPRNSSGQKTAQSEFVKKFATRFKSKYRDYEIHFQDETLTSVEAERRLKARGRAYQKADIDAESAVIILQDFIDSCEIQASNLNIKIEEVISLLSPTTPKTKSKLKSIEAFDPRFDSNGTIKIHHEVTKKIPIAPISTPVPDKTPHSQKSTTKSKNLTKLSTKLKSTAQKAKKLTKLKSKKAPAAQDTSKPSIKTPKKLNKLKIALISSLALPIILVFFGILWYNINITAISPKSACENATLACIKAEFKIKNGETADSVIKNLHNLGIIKSREAFFIYLKLNGRGSNFKAGIHSLNSSMNANEIATALEKSSNQNVFKLTILPGHSLTEIKDTLLKKGYGTIEIAKAFAKEYDHPVLETKPKNASLEGYLYAETYEFFKDESVENIIKSLLDQTYKVVQENNIIEGYKARKMTLHQGLTLASIIQKETNKDHAIVAQIFEKRLNQGEKLGSDVTVSYALKMIDPARQIYNTNAKKIEINSPYNTRKNPGLPPTPIASPGIDAIRAVAHPANTDYFYFLTGDDGKMYYSKTDAEHNHNIRQFCQKLCAVEL